MQKYYILSVSIYDKDSDDETKLNEFHNDPRYELKEVYVARHIINFVFALKAEHWT